MIEGVEYFDGKEINDLRGSFNKLFSIQWDKSISINLEEVFVTSSVKGTTRGMHIHIGPSKNWKIISVVAGTIFDVLVDLRATSESFLKINEKKLSAGASILLPPGIAHGFQALENTNLLYLSSKSRVEKLDVGFNVQSLKIDWPLNFEIQSERDNNLPNIDSFLKNLHE